MTDTPVPPIQKPQVILRITDEHGNIHMIKKWHDKSLSIEGHTAERAANHNINVPAYFFPIDQEFAAKEFKNAGKEYRP